MKRAWVEEVEDEFKIVCSRKTVCEAGTEVVIIFLRDRETTGGGCASVWVNLEEKGRGETET